MSPNPNLPLREDLRRSSQWRVLAGGRRRRRMRRFLFGVLVLLALVLLLLVLGTLRLRNGGPATSPHPGSQQTGELLKV